jgi:hypothetical protein
MSYTVKTLHDDSVVLFTAHKDFNRAEDMEQVIHDVMAILDDLDEPVYHVLDWKEGTLNMDDMAEGASATTRRENPVFHHPMVKEVIFVTDNPAIKMIAANMRSGTFGNVKTKVFETLDEAMAHVRFD